MSQTASELAGTVAIVTGAGGAGGIGETTARVLAEAGAKLVLADVAGSQVRGIAEALAKEGFEAVAHATDISSEDEVKALMDFTYKTYGRLDALDNNAAMQAQVADTTVGDMPVELWDTMMGVNARGAMLMCKHALPLMIAGGGGSIINIASGTALAGDFFATAYACTKGAIITLTKYVATQYGRQGVRCNAVSPGLIMTSKLAEAMPAPFQELLRQQSITQTLGERADIANIVAFLASDRAAFITGQNIQVDGGIYAHIPSAYDMQAMIKKMQGG